MEKQTAIRRVRIAVSVCFGVLTLVLVVLWVRSYWWAHEVIDRAPLVGGVFVQSSQGGIAVKSLPIRKNTALDDRLPIYGRMRVLSNEEMKSPQIMNSTGITAPEYCGFALSVESLGNWRVATPYWLLVLVTGSLAAVTCYPKVARRFSLAGLLIATTMVAIVLGVSVWLAGA